MTLRLAVLTVAVLSVAAVWSRPLRADGPTLEDQGPVLPVPVLEVAEVRSFSVARRYTGHVEARRSVELAFEVSGRLAAMGVSDGAAVSSGQVLGRLDRRRLTARRRDLGAQLAAAQAQLAEMVAGPRRQTIAAARARVAEREAELDLLALKVRRREELVERRVSSEEELDELRTALRAETARVEVARQQLQELEEGTRREQVQAQEALVEQLEAALELVEIDLADSELKAPFAGRVDAVLTDEGTVVQPGAPVLRLLETGSLEAWVGVPASALAAVPTGSPQTVWVGGRQIQATVRSCLPMLEARTRTATVVLALDAIPHQAVLPEQMVRLEVAEPVDERGFWLPLSALVKGERDLWSCFALEQGEGGDPARVARRHVEVVYVDETRALVRGKLSSGERVVAAGVHKLVPGQRVRPAAGSAEEPAQGQAQEPAE